MMEDDFAIIERDPRTLSRVNQKRYVRERIAALIARRLEQEASNGAPWLADMTRDGIDLGLIQEEAYRMARRVRSSL